MRVGISTASFFNTSNLEEAPERLVRLGASVCEIFLNTFSEYDEAFIAVLKQHLVEHDMQVYSVHPMGVQFEGQLFSMHPKQRQDAWKIYEQVLQAAQTLGATCYVMHGPAHMFGAAKHMALDRIGPVVQDLCVLAGEYGVTLAWENVSWCLFHTPDYGPRLLEATRADDLRFTLDIKQAMRSGYAPLQFVDTIGEFMVNLHICDYAHDENGRIHPILPGRGECDLIALRAELEKKGYKGPAFLEVYSDLYKTEEELKASFTYIKKCMQ